MPQSTVWHHTAEPPDAKQWPLGQNCLSYPQTHDRFLYSHDVAHILLKIREIILSRQQPSCMNAHLICTFVV